MVEQAPTTGQTNPTNVQVQKKKQWKKQQTSQAQPTQQPSSNPK